MGNIVTGDDSQTQAILECNALPAFHTLLRHNKINIQKEAAWAISNITAGNTTQIQAVIDSGVMPLIIDVLHKASYFITEQTWHIYYCMTL